ncbi:hypothetical protein EBZ39_02630 [bacterium]|nr:hypothetical protein [bacterium]
MPAPDLIFEHGLDVKKGWFDMASLDYSAKLDPSISFALPRGRVVFVNSTGFFVPGVHKTNVAIFLLNGSTDADVSNPGTTASGRFMHQAIAPTGKLSGLVATGGYEIASTEFDSTQTYAPGDLLTATRTATPAATDGVLTNASVTQYVRPVVGVVSSGSVRNHNNVLSLSFWTVWLPGAANWTP